MRVSLAEGKALVRGIYKELCFLERRFTGERNHLVAVYDSHEEAAKAIEALVNQAKIKQTDISIVGKGANEEPKDTFEVQKENKDILFWGEQGALWGGALGFLMGAFASFIPDFGPLTGQFVDLGIEEAEAHRYADFLKEGKIVVLVHSKDKAELEKAKDALKETKTDDIKIYSVCLYQNGASILLKELYMKKIFIYLLTLRTIS